MLCLGTRQPHGTHILFTAPSPVYRICLPLPRNIRFPAAARAWCVARKVCAQTTSFISQHIPIWRHIHALRLSAFSMARALLPLRQRAGSAARWQGMAACRAAPYMVPKDTRGRSDVFSVDGRCASADKNGSRGISHTLPLPTACYQPVRFLRAPWRIFHHIAAAYAI